MRDDLISRTALMQSLRNNVLVDVTPNLEQAIAEQPTAYNVDKVAEQLEEYAHSSICKTHEHGCPYLTNDDVSCENCGAIGALEIVKSGGIE